MDTGAPAQYQQRLHAHMRELERAERLHIRIGNIQIGLVTLAIVAALLGLSLKVFSVLWLLVPIASIVALAVAHERVLRRRTRTRRVVAFYEYVLDRVRDRWAGKGESGSRFLDPSHPYAKDLDLFGEGSLFEYISTARTRGGEEKLAEWLLSPSTPEVLKLRREAVRELAPALDLREQLAVLGEDIRVGVNPEALAAWGMGTPRLATPGRWFVAAVLSALGIGTLLLWIATGAASPFVAVFLATRVFTFRFRRELEQMIAAVERPGHDLRLLSEVLVVLERQRFTSSRLVQLQSGLVVEGLPPSRRIARLYRLLELLDSRDNLALRVIDPIALWTVHMAFFIEAWRAKSGPLLNGWLEVVGEMEALLSLAAYHYEHPDDPFPEFATESPAFDGEQLGHPLIPEARCVCNDVRLDRGLQVLVVSGSNMSGKSTLLRAVGTNAVLAMAGAPVRARRLRLSPLAVGASIRTLDSLQSGTSRFYAEITRLGQLVALTERGRPLLFLLDELLHGTNSHDRRIGAEGVVRALVERGAIGLITTHDLALASIADELAPLAVNTHFQDQIENGRMTFDYRLRPGVVEHSNALDLMRSIGLEV